MKALLDTGSPATIVGLKFALKVLATKQQLGQSPQEWATCVQSWMQQPTVTLQNYSGGTLNVVRQMTVQLSKGDRHPQALVYIHPGGGTSRPAAGYKHASFVAISSPVGSGGWSTSGHVFRKTSVKEQGGDRDIKEQVTSQRDSLQTNMDNASDLSPVGIVHLLCPTRLPPCQAKLTTVRMEGKNQQFLPERVESLLAEKGVLVETGLVQVDKEGCSIHLLQNRIAEPICFKEGRSWGGPKLSSLYTALPEEDNSVRRLKVGSSNPTSDNTVGEATFPHLSAVERGQLQSCLQEYAGLFANGDLNLGSTDMVTHTIDTSDHPAIRQPPRHVPFALRSHVEKIRQMAEQEVIQPSKNLLANRIVLVAKKDGTTHFSVGYRKLNAITKMDVHPLPRIDDSFNLLSGQ